MPSTIRYGSTGPDVVELQTKLNLRPPTLLPPLITDGIFGQNTKTRVIEFQGNNKLERDGIVGPLTWSAVNAVNPTRPVTPNVAVLGSLGDRIIFHARKQVGMIDYSRRIGSPPEPYGWQHLGTILERGARKKFPDAKLKATPNPDNISWCGIFCVYCYQLANKNVVWVNGVGPQGAIKKVWPWNKKNMEEFKASIQPGDIAYDPMLKHHHFIVVSIDPKTGAIKSIDGNMSNGRIMELNIRNLSQVAAYYTPI